MRAPERSGAFFFAAFTVGVGSAECLLRVGSGL